MDDGRTPGAAPDDGRVRRAVLEVRLGASVRCPGRQSPGRHAVAALRHVRDGRARADRDRPRRRARSAGPTPRTLGVALVYLGEHYVVDLPPGSRWPRAIRARRAARRARCAAACRARVQRARGAGARHERRARRRRRSRRAAPRAAEADGRTTRTSRRRSSSPRRSLLALGGFLLASIAALYFLLPQLAGLEDTWHRIEDGSPCWIVARAASSTLGMFGGYVAMFRGVFVRAAPTRIGWRESYQITMAGLAATRLFAAGGAGGLVLHGVGAAPRRACARARRGRQDGRLPGPHLLPVRGRADRLRPRAAARASSPARRRSRSRSCPAIIALIADRRSRWPIALVPTDLQRRARAASRAATAASAGSPQRLAHAARRGVGRHARRARTTCASRDPALLGAVAFWAFHIARAVGGVPARSATRRRSRCSSQAFFVGMLGNLLPMPGGVGGVEGGMIGALRGLRRRRRPGGRRRARLPRVHVLAADDPRRDRLLPAAHDASSAGARGAAERATLYKVK